VMGWPWKATERPCSNQDQRVRSQLEEGAGHVKIKGQLLTRKEGAKRFGAESGHKGLGGCHQELPCYPESNGSPRVSSAGDFIPERREQEGKWPRDGTIHDFWRCPN
jgi:hypothetical protein